MVHLGRLLPLDPMVRWPRWLRNLIQDLNNVLRVKMAHNKHVRYQVYRVFKCCFIVKPKSLVPLLKAALNFEWNSELRKTRSSTESESDIFEISFLLFQFPLYLLLLFQLLFQYHFLSLVLFQLPALLALFL